LFRLLAFCLFAIVSEEDTASIVSTEKAAFSVSHSAPTFLSGALDMDRSCLTGHGWPSLVLKRWQTSKIADGATTGKVKMTAFWDAAPCSTADIDMSHAFIGRGK
jgi:hypothetical protein